MEASKESTEGESNYYRNEVQDRSLLCESSGKLKPYKEDMKYRGVRKISSGRFGAQISDPITKQNCWLGTYDTAELAASAYDSAARAMRGTEAITNFPNVILDPCMFTPSSSGKLKPYKKYMKYRGVRKSLSGRFGAHIKDPITKQQRWLGTYDTAEQAASAYDSAALAMRGTKATTNFPNVIFDPCKFTPSSTNFNHPVLSKSSNLDDPLSNSLFNKHSHKQDHLFFGDSSSKLSSPTNQNISASGQPITTNDFSIPCPFPYTQSFQVSSSPTKPFLNKTTSTVREAISTTSSLPNPVFPLHHISLPLVEDLASTPQSQQCSTVMPSNSFSSNVANCSYSHSGMLEKIKRDFTVPPISTIESSSTICSSTCNINSTLDYGIGFPQKTYSTTTPCTIIHSTTGLLNLDLLNQNEQQWIDAYDIEKELSNIQLPADWYTDS